jgi:hypothetical protein
MTSTDSPAVGRGPDISISVPATTVGTVNAHGGGGASELVLADTEMGRITIAARTIALRSERAAG